MAPPLRHRAAGQRNQVGLLGTVELTILPARGLLSEQSRREAFLHEGLADPVPRRSPALHRLGHPVVVPTRPVRPGIGLEQNPRMDDHGRRPLPSANQVFQFGTFLGGQVDDCLLYTSRCV